MEYRKLNLIDGPDQDLHDFMRLLKEALEHKRVGSAQLVNMELMSKLIAVGSITCNILSDEGKNIGLQIFEKAQFWFDTSLTLANMRLQYVRGDVSATVYVAFTLWGAEQARVTGTQVITTVEETDQLYPLLPLCTFEDFAVVKKI